MVVKACISDTHTLDKSVFLTIVHRRQPPMAAIEHLTQKFDTRQENFSDHCSRKGGRIFPGYHWCWWLLLGCLLTTMVTKYVEPKDIVATSARTSIGVQRPCPPWPASRAETIICVVCMSRSLECTLPSLLAYVRIVGSFKAQSK